MPDDREVAHVPGQRLAQHALRCVQANDRCTRNAQHRLEIFADVRAVLLEHPVRVAEAERRTPPTDVVVARDADDVADAFGLPNELAGTLELTGPRALR